MPIVAISRGSYHHGKNIAEKLAVKLGYSCISRDDVIESLEEFHLPELKLVRGLNDVLSVLDRFPHGKERYKVAVRAVILQHFLSGNVVYHGLVAHHFIRHIPHVLKVRIVADTERRINNEMTRENISEGQARYILKKDDEERRKWGMFLYGIDLVDPEAYNLVIRIGHISEDDAVEIIAQATKLPAFQETAESRTNLADAALEARVRKALFDFPSATVAVKDGRVNISLKAPENQHEIIGGRIEEMLADVEGLQNYKLRFERYY